MIKDRRITGILPLILFFVVLLVDSTLLIMTHTGWEASQSYYIPLRDQLSRSNTELAKGHLWLEEYISGDDSIDPQKYIFAPVEKIINEARNINSVPNELVSTYFDAESREYFFRIEWQMKHYYQVLSDRVTHKDTQGVGSEADIKFDTLFHDVELLINNESARIYEKMLEETVSRNQFFIIALIVFIVSNLIALIALVYYRKNKMIFESRLHEQKELSEITLASIGDAVITTDAVGNIARMNPVAERLTGWPLQEAQGEPLKLIFPIIHTTTRKALESPADKVLATGETIHLSNHTTLISKDGTECQIANSAAPIRSDNKLLGMVLVFNDVTEQYQLRDAASKNKKYMQSIMDNSPAIIYVKDIEGRFTFVNNKFVELFHINNEDIVGKTLHQIFPQDIAEIMASNDKDVLMAENTLESEEIVHSDDGARTYHSIKFPLRDGDNNIYAICGISTDVTEQKEKDEQLRRSQKMDALGKLTGGIAHDYNNMLGIILGYSEMIECVAREHPELTELTKCINEISHAGERGAKLTKKLLTFSRHESSDNKIVNLNALLDSSQLMLEKALTARISLAYDLEKNCWSIDLDESDLEDAILNISINAMHAIEGAGQITFETRNETIKEMDAQNLKIPAGDYVLLSITDTGCGMDDKTKENIFDPFFSTKAEFGIGLGLSQVYGFARRSKGNVKVASDLGHGSRFTLYFPRYYEVDIKEKQFEEKEEADLSGSHIILVVDDEAALAILTSHVLTEQGYQVFIANSGKEALLILEKESVDVLFSDVTMPEMDGYELAAIVHEKYPNIKIQLASGFNDDRHVDDINVSLHKNLLHKPYHSKKLLLRIRELINDSSD